MIGVLQFMCLFGLFTFPDNRIQTIRNYFKIVLFAELVLRPGLASVEIEENDNT